MIRALALAAVLVAGAAAAQDAGELPGLDLGDPDFLGPEPMLPVPDDLGPGPDGTARGTTTRSRLSVTSAATLQSTRGNSRSVGPPWVTSRLSPRRRWRGTSSGSSSSVTSGGSRSAVTESWVARSAIAGGSITTLF